jgi:hypothetical protein
VYLWALRKLEAMQDGPDQPFFRPGEPIVETGIYRVYHGDHRLTHEVALLERRDLSAMPAERSTSAF